MLARVPRLSDEQSAAIADHFGELAKLLRATADDIAAVDGVSLKEARSVKESLDRLTETTILDQYY